MIGFYSMENKDKNNTIEQWNNAGDAFLKGVLIGGVVSIIIFASAICFTLMS